MCNFRFSLALFSGTTVRKGKVKVLNTRAFAMTRKEHVFIETSSLSLEVFTLLYLLIGIIKHNFKLKSLDFNNMVFDFQNYLL